MREHEGDSNSSQVQTLRTVLPKHQLSTMQPPSHQLDKAPHGHWAGTDTELNHSEASTDESVPVPTKNVVLQHQAPIQPVA